MADEKSQGITRRNFLERLGILAVGSSLAAMAGGIIAYFWPPKLEETPSEPVPAGTVADLKRSGGVTVPYGRYPALVIWTGRGPMTYSAVCTHFACIVKYHADVDKIICPCHDGYFDPEDGHVISGPPPEPLHRLPWYYQGPDGTIVSRPGTESDQPLSDDELEALEDEGEIFVGIPPEEGSDANAIRWLGERVRRWLT